MKYILKHKDGLPCVIKKYDGEKWITVELGQEVDIRYKRFKVLSNTPARVELELLEDREVPEGGTGVCNPKIEFDKAKDNVTFDKDIVWIRKKRRKQIKKILFLFTYVFSFVMMVVSISLWRCEPLIIPFIVLALLSRFALEAMKK